MSIQSYMPKSFNLNANTLLAILVVVVVAAMVAQFSSIGEVSRWVNNKSQAIFKNEASLQQESDEEPQQQQQSSDAPKQQAQQQSKPQQQQAASQELGALSDDSEYATVDGLKSRDPSQNCIDLQGQWISSNLLPKDDPKADEDWSVSAPGKLEDQNFLEAGHHFGSDTVANTLRNANYQLRSEPAIPKTNVGPWANTTIDADKFRRPFEVEEASA